MLAQLAGNAGPANAASDAATANRGAAVSPAAFSFNPFDQTSWWTNPPASLGTTVDALA